MCACTHVVMYIATLHQNFVDLSNFADVWINFADVWINFADVWINFANVWLNFVDPSE